MMKVITYGCAVNQSDSEIIQGLLYEAGLDSDEFIIVNTCTVKTPTENKIIKMLRGLDGGDVPVIVCGCIPRANPDIAREFPDFSFLGTNIQDICEAVFSALKGNRFVKIDGASEKLKMPCLMENKFRAIVQVSEGCLGSCKYCQTRHARGRLKSYPIKEIKKKVEKHVEDGVREIWLTSQDMGAYGIDIGKSLPELLEGVTSVEGDFKVRVGMMNPGHINRFSNELIKSFKSEKIYKFAHIPVQSGDDKVLKDMGRGYTVDEFEDIADNFRRINATISTDLIVGYPTETEEAFKKTLDMVSRVEPDIVNATRYWARPKTPAAKLKQLPGRETKRRSRILTSLCQGVSLNGNRKWIGWEGPCLVSEINKDKTATARNQWYKPIIIPNAKLGETLWVRVNDATHYDLRGEVLQSASSDKHKKRQTKKPKA
jgi:threonylcarbamoyladenosine tRNA methylthiotransferase CDKAL1